MLHTCSAAYTALLQRGQMGVPPNGCMVSQSMYIKSESGQQIVDDKRTRRSILVCACQTAPWRVTELVVSGSGGGSAIPDSRHLSNSNNIVGSHCMALATAQGLSRSFTASSNLAKRNGGACLVFLSFPAAMCLMESFAASFPWFDVTASRPAW